MKFTRTITIEREPDINPEVILIGGPSTLDLRVPFQYQGVPILKLRDLLGELRATLSALHGLDENLGVFQPIASWNNALNIVIHGMDMKNDDMERMLVRDGGVPIVTEAIGQNRNAGSGASDGTTNKMINGPDDTVELIIQNTHATQVLNIGFDASTTASYLVLQPGEIFRIKTWNGDIWENSPNGTTWRSWILRYTP